MKGTKAFVIAIIICSLLILLSVTVSADEKTKSQKEIYKEYAKEVAESYGISPCLVWSIIEQESSWNENAYNKEGSKGLFQIYEKWHKEEMELFDVDNLFEPFGNIDIGVYYLNELIQNNLDEYGDVDIAYVLDLYNGNTKAKYNRDNGILSKYSREVLDRAYQFEKEMEE